MTKIRMVQHFFQPPLQDILRDNVCHCWAWDIKMNDDGTPTFNPSILSWSAALCPTADCQTLEGRKHYIVADSRECTTCTVSYIINYDKSNWMVGGKSNCCWCWVYFHPKNISAPNWCCWACIVPAASVRSSIDCPCWACAHSIITPVCIESGLVSCIDDIILQVTWSIRATD